VLSITLDEWSEEEIESVLEVGGNSYANAIYEAFLPKGFSKPKSCSSTEERMDFIRSKYELQQFLKPSLRMLSLTTSKRYLNTTNSLNVAGGTEKLEDVDENIGMLRVKIIRGINLAVRDMLTSDPYVVLLLGEQKVQTAAITSNLNPVWNEELEIAIPKNFNPLKLQVYDYDMFSQDDIMGEAEIDIQPLITAAMAFGDPSMLEDMQIGRWLKSDDNALVHDSRVNIVGGKFKQELKLELQNVESGEIELELEWIAFDN
ncbi:ARF-GAP domain 13, partial [Zostera marina]